MERLIKQEVHEIITAPYFLVNQSPLASLIRNEVQKQVKNAVDTAMMKHEQKSLQQVSQQPVPKMQLHINAPVFEPKRLSNRPSNGAHSLAVPFLDQNPSNAEDKNMISSKETISGTLVTYPMPLTEWRPVPDEFPTVTSQKPFFDP